MKSLFLTFFISVLLSTSHAQGIRIDSLRQILKVTESDSNRVLIMSEMSSSYRLLNLDSALYYGQKSLAMAQDIKYLRGEVSSMISLARFFREEGNLPKAMDLSLQALRISESEAFYHELIRGKIALGVIYFDLKDFDTSIEHCRDALKIGNQYGSKFRNYLMMNIGASYVYSDLEFHLDSASKYLKQVQHTALISPFILRLLGKGVSLLWNCQ